MFFLVGSSSSSSLLPSSSANSKVLGWLCLRPLLALNASCKFLLTSSILLFGSSLVDVREVMGVSLKPSDALLVLLRLRLGVLGLEAKKPTLPMFWKLSFRGS